MSGDYQEPKFDADDVIKISGYLIQEENVFLVGGQAISLWAKVFEHNRTILELGNLTSKDVDYFGTAEEARRLANAMRGSAKIATFDDMGTPNTAIINVTVNKKELQIDFLHSLLGVTHKDLRTGVAEVRLRLAGDDTEEVRILLLHPVLCLQSRVGNMTFPGYRRRDETAWRQLKAAYAIVDHYIDDALQMGEIKEVQRCLADILRFVRSNPAGKVCLLELNCDLLKLVEPRLHDCRLDDRFREKTLRPQIKRLRSKQEKRLAKRMPTNDIDFPNSASN